MHGRAGRFHIVAIKDSTNKCTTVLCNSVLGTRGVVTFGPRFRLGSLLGEDGRTVGPLVFELGSDREMECCSVLPFVTGRRGVCCFCSGRSR